MDELIELHSITSAAGWRFADGVQAVACFALATVKSGSIPDYTYKVIVPLYAEEVAEDLTGMMFDLNSRRDLIFRN